MGRLATRRVISTSVVSLQVGIDALGNFATVFCQGLVGLPRRLHHVCDTTLLNEEAHRAKRKKRQSCI